MARLPIKTGVLRALFARSGNQCAFPGCAANLVNEKNQFIAQVCHIESAHPKGQRFNISQSDEQRRSYENLVLLCYPHHVETNDVSTYTVEILKEIKYKHEAAFEKNNFKIDESLLYKISREMTEYWSRIEELHSSHHTALDLAIPIDANATYSALSKEAQGLLDEIRSLRDVMGTSDDRLYEDLLAVVKALGFQASALDAHEDKVRAFQYRNWEALCLGFPNIVTRLSGILMQMEIKYLEEYLKTNCDDPASGEKMKKLKEEFESFAVSAGYID